MKASILINNYNYEAYVEKAISSALNQTYKDIEVILYDDGSTDSSLKIINKFSDKIKIIARKNYEKGHCWNQINAVNEAFKASTGDVIFLMDSDDWFFQDKVEKIVDNFNSNPDALYIQHRFELVDENDTKLNIEKRPFYSEIDVLSGIYFIKRLDMFFTQTSGQCFRRSLLEKFLPLQEDELSLVCVDVRLTRYAAFEGKIITLQDKLASYRIHTKNHSSVLKNADYYSRFDEQNLVFFNRIAQLYNYPSFTKGSVPISYLKVLILLIRSGMSGPQKKIFLKNWYKSYTKK